MANEWMKLTEYAQVINYSGPQDSAPNAAVSFHDGPDHTQVHKANYFKEIAKIESKEGNAQRKGTNPSIERGKLYYPSITDEVRDIIEPFSDPWLDPAILVGPGPAPFGMEPPVVTPNPYIPVLGGQDAVSNMVTSELGKGPIIKENIPKMPEPVKTYIVRTALDLTKWITVDTQGLRDVADDKLSGSKLQATITNATSALHMNVINQNLQAITDVLDNIHDSTVSAMENYTILIASFEGNLKAVNHMMDRMAKEKLNTVIDEVVTNIIAAVEKIPISDIEENAKAWVDRMAAYPEWSPTALLNLAQEYQPTPRVKDMLKAGLDVLRSVRDSDGVVISGELDVISDVASEMTEYQVSVAVAI